MTNKNERALTEDEKSDFLSKLSELVLEYGVEFVIEASSDSEFLCKHLVIQDAVDRQLFSCSCSFDATDAHHYTQEKHDE